MICFVLAVWLAITPDTEQQATSRPAQTDHQAWSQFGESANRDFFVANQPKATLKPVEARIAGR